MRLSRPALCAMTVVILGGGSVAIWTVSTSGWSPLTGGGLQSALPSLHREVAPVPVACSVAPLSEVTDPDALMFETGDRVSGTVDVNGLKPHTVNALNKFEKMITSMGGKFKITSAYRPVAYQEHLRAVWEKWMNELRDNQEPSCETLRAEVGREFTRHGLLVTQRPAASSDHTKGTGFDAMVSLPPVVKVAAAPRRRAAARKLLSLDRLARICGLMRPNPSGDRVHFRFRS